MTMESGITGVLHEMVRARYHLSKAIAGARGLPRSGIPWALLPMMLLDLNKVIREARMEMKLPPQQEEPVPCDPYQLSLPLEVETKNAPF